MVQVNAMMVLLAMALVLVKNTLPVMLVTNVPMDGLVFNAISVSISSLATIANRVHVYTENVMKE